MSTQQQPPGASPEGTPGYTPPQDPWAGGFEPGHASVPTDPIPQHYDPYAGNPPGEVWSQPTVVAHGQPYAYVPQPVKKGNGGAIAVVVLLVLLLGGGGGYAAYRFLTAPSTTNPPPSGPTTTTVQTSAAAGFDPQAVVVGDCVFNKGTAEAPNLITSTCSTPHSYKVIKIAHGLDIPEGPTGKFDDTTAVAVCAGTGYQTWYGYQAAVDHATDVFFCMTNN